MAANDSVSNELSKKTRKVEEMNEKGQEYANMQAANQHLQEISAERMKNVALQRQDVVQTTGTTQLLAEAGQMANMDSGDSQSIALNPSTQATLSKFGLGQPRVQRTQGRSVSIKPNNITINNTYNTTTNNNVNPGPLQGRTVTINPKAETPAQSRYKTWISNVFAKQKLEQDRKEREYDRREWSLTKSANKMIRKMESASRDVANTFNPKNIGQTIGNQFKILMFLFGMKFLAKNWTGILDFGKRIYDGIINIGAFFGIGDKGRQWASQGRDFRGRLITFLGGPKNRNNKNATLFSVFKEIFDEFREYLKIWFEKQMALRGVAMRNIKFPDLKIGGEAGTGVEWVDRLISGFGNILSKTFSGVGTYLGDILTALVDPKAGISRSMSSQLNLDSREDSEKARYRKGEASEFTNHGDFNSGDYANVEIGSNGKRKYSIFANAIDSGGNLNEGAGNEVSQGRDILGAFQDAKEYGALDTSRAVGGLERLYNAAVKRDSVIVDDEFMHTLYGPWATETLVSQGKVKKVKMKFVEDTMTTDDKNAENEYANKVYGGNTVPGELAKGPMSLLNIAADVALGRPAEKILEHITDPFTVVPRTVGAVVQSGRRSGELKDKKYTLVPESDPRKHATIDGRETKSGIYYQLTPEALDYLAKTRFNSDRFSKEHYTTLLPGAEALLTSFGGGASAMDRNWKLKGEGSRYFSGQRDSRADEYLRRYQELKNTESVYDARLDASDWNNHVNQWGNNVKQFGNGVVSWVGGVMQGAGDNINGFFHGGKGEQLWRQEYMMSLLTEKAGLSVGAAAGVVGSLKNEGLLNPNVGITVRDDNGAASGGIAGFRGAPGNPFHPGTQLGQLKAWADARGLKWNDFKTQANFLVYGSNHAKTALDIIRRNTAGKSGPEAARLSSIIWGRNYERFAGHLAYDDYGNLTGQDRHKTFRVNGKWYTKDGKAEYDKRARHAVGTYEYFAKKGLGSSTSATGYSNSAGVFTSTPMISLNPSVSSGGVSGGTSIVWLGDSQTCTANSGFPKGVAAGLGVTIPFFGMGSARASHYLGKEKLASTSSTNIPELKGKSCNDAFTNFLGRKPNYCIIALGHNGNSGMQELISAFRNNGTKVIVIKMWATKAAPGTGMKSYTPEESNALYAGLNADGFVDLTKFEVKKTSDGVHADVKGCKDAAAETVRQLKGGGFSVGNDSFNSSGSEVYSSGGGSYYSEGGGSYSLGDDVYNAGVRLENWQPFNVKTEAELKQERKTNLLKGSAADLWEKNKDYFSNAGITFEQFQKEWLKADDNKRKKTRYEVADWTRNNNYKNNQENLRTNKESLLNRWNKDSLSRKFRIDNKISGELFDLIIEGRLDEAKKKFDKYEWDQTLVGNRRGKFSHLNKDQDFENFKNTLIYGQEYTDLLEKIKSLEESVKKEKDVDKKSELQLDLELAKGRRKAYSGGAISARKGDSYQVQAEIKDQNKKIKDAKIKLSDAVTKRDNFEVWFNRYVDSLEGPISATDYVKLHDKMYQAVVKDVEEAEKYMMEVDGKSKEEVQKYKESVEKHLKFTRANKIELKKEFDQLGKGGKTYLEGVKDLYEKYGEDALKSLGITLDDLNKEFVRVKQEGYNMLSYFEKQQAIEIDRRMGKISESEAARLNAENYKEGMLYGITISGEERERLKSVDKVTDKLSRNAGINAWEVRFALENKDNVKNLNNRDRKRVVTTLKTISKKGYNPDGTRTDGYDPDNIPMKGAGNTNFYGGTGTARDWNIFGRIPGRAIGGYTEPGEVLEESKYKLHKGEWVAPQWMVKSKEYGSIIKSLENHRRTVSGDAVKTNSSDDKAKSLDIAANISTAQNTSGTNQRLDQLIQIIASQGKAQGRVLSPKTREQSFTR